MCAVVWEFWKLSAHINTVNATLQTLMIFSFLPYKNSRWLEVETKSPILLPGADAVGHLLRLATVTLWYGQQKE